MPNIHEAKSGVKALFLQAASLSGLEVSEQSPERLVQMVNDGFARIKPERQPEAVANLLKVMAETLMVAQKKGITTINESTVDAGKKKVCPIFPYD
jgi:hypothetical protein